MRIPWLFVLIVALLSNGTSLYAEIDNDRFIENQNVEEMEPAVEELGDSKDIPVHEEDHSIEGTDNEDDTINNDTSGIAGVLKTQQQQPSKKFQIFIPMNKISMMRGSAMQRLARQLSDFHERQVFRANAAMQQQAAAVTRSDEGDDAIAEERAIRRRKRVRRRNSKNRINRVQNNRHVANHRQNSRRRQSNRNSLRRRNTRRFNTSSNQRRKNKTVRRSNKNGHSNPSRLNKRRSSTRKGNRSNKSKYSRNGKKSSSNNRLSKISKNKKKRKKTVLQDSYTNQNAIPKISVNGKGQFD